MINLRDCDNCGLPEERLLIDTWTGRALCVACLSPIIDRLALSPASEGDNLYPLLKEEAESAA